MRIWAWLVLGHGNGWQVSRKKQVIHVWTKGKTGPQHVQFVWWDGQQLQFCQCTPILDQMPARCLLWQFSNLTPRALSIYAKFLVGNSKNILNQMERLSSHRASFAISLLAWTLLQVLGFFPFFTSKFQCNQKCLGTRLNKCLRTLKCFVDKQITIFTFVFF